MHGLPCAARPLSQNRRGRPWWMKAGQASVITSKIASEADRLCPPPDTVLRAGHERRTGGHRAFGQLGVYSPPAAQVPADEHDTELVADSLAVSRAARPGTSMALVQRPPRSLTTNAA